MTDEQKDAVAKELTTRRDELLRTASEARNLRTSLRLENRGKQADFLQKIGELSFAFGGAIVPVLIISHTADTVSHSSYVLIGLAIYLMSGIVALWKVKTQIEQDADDTPWVGIKEELMIYPVTNAINKLLSDLDNDSYKKEYLDACGYVTDSGTTADGKPSKPKASFWLDVAILNFVIASLFVVRAIWHYGTGWYWLMFGISVLLILILMTVSYRRTIKNQKNLQTEREKLQNIKNDSQTWFNNTFNPTHKSDK